MIKNKIEFWAKLSLCFRDDANLKDLKWTIDNLDTQIKRVPVVGDEVKTESDKLRNSETGDTILLQNDTNTAYGLKFVFFICIRYTCARLVTCLLFALDRCQ